MGGSFGLHSSMTSKGMIKIRGKRKKLELEGGGAGIFGGDKRWENR